MFAMSCVCVRLSAGLSANPLLATLVCDTRLSSLLE